MPKNELVLVDGFLRDNKGERPLDVVFEGKRLIDFHDSGLRAKLIELILVKSLPTLSKRLTTGYFCYKKLLRNSKLHQSARDIISINISPDT